MYRTLLIFRKVQPVFFSIERVFASLFPENASDSSYPRYVLPWYTSGLKAIIKNIRAVRHLKADVYHITGDAHYVLAGLPPSRTILTIHDCVFLHQYSGPKRFFLKWLLLDMPVRRAKMITTISENTKREIVENTHCSPAKIWVIPNPVNETIYFKEKEFDTIKPVILFIGSTPNKNLERCIEALRGIKCKLQIIGKINPAQAQLLETNRIDYNIAHGLSDLELANAYASSDIVLFPSTFEGFGLPIVEAQRAGRVVITSRLSPMKEVAGEGAFLVNPFEAKAIREGIKAVINNNSLRNELVQKGFTNVQHYTATAISEKYRDLYKQVAKQFQSQ